MTDAILRWLLDPRRRAGLVAYPVAAFVLLLFGVLLPATGPFQPITPEVSGSVTRPGTVLEIVNLERTPSATGTRVFEQIAVEVDGETVTVERSYVEGQWPLNEVAAGDGVLIQSSETPAGAVHFLVDRQRGGTLWLLALIFALFVVAVGRWHGLGSLLGLGASVLVIGRFVIPGILAGRDPVFVSILGAMVLVSTTLLLAHGPNLKTALTMVATALALLATGLLARLGVAMLELGGLAHEEPAQLFVLTNGVIDPRGLLLAGFVIGAVGVLDDVTATQVSTVQELRSADPTLGVRELYRRAMNVGRDHVASTVNTLLLAYAGAALPLLLVLATQGESLGVLVQQELFATEVARTMVGSLGIVGAVPLTTGLAALVLGRRAGTPSVDQSPAARSSES